MTVLAPRSLREARGMLAENAGACPVSGGTGLVVEINTGERLPEKLLSLSLVTELRGIKSGEGAVRIGAATTCAEVERSPLLTGHPALTAAAGSVGTRQIRNRGTVAGNLARAAPTADLLPPLLIAEAELELDGPRGARMVPLAAFLQGPSVHGAAPDELIVGARFRAAEVSQAFSKVRVPTAAGSATFILAVGADRERGEACAAFGSPHVMPVPVRVPLGDGADPLDALTDALDGPGDEDEFGLLTRRIRRTMLRRALFRLGLASG